MKILLVEDDQETADYVKQGLHEAGHQVEVAADGNEGLSRATGETWDILIVDRMLPGLDGLSLVRTLRSGGGVTPVLFLTTLGGIDDRVTGLKAGGDDYLVKPFALIELVARVEVLGRRPPRPATETKLKVDTLEINVLTRTVTRSGRKVHLQPRELRLLEYLVRHVDQVVTRTMLLEQVWDFHFDPRTNVVETLISRLRAKVDSGHPVELIHTVRGAGYCIRAPS